MLTIIGLGPAHPGMVTLEALEALRHGVEQSASIYALAHARATAEALIPEIKVKLVEYPRDVERSAFYSALARRLMQAAFEEGRQVIYLVAGSPLFYNDAVLVLRMKCAQQDLPLRLIHGLSFLDLVLDGVYWTGHDGLQLFSAWNLVHEQIELRPDVAALLIQVGEHSSAGDAVDIAESASMVQQLQHALLLQYPADHRVAILFSTGPPEYRNRAKQLLLSELGNEQVPVYSNLWVPGLGGPPMERFVTPHSTLP